MNTGAPWSSLEEAEPRVLAMQTKLHQWAVSDAGRRFDDLYNLVYDPAFLSWRGTGSGATRVRARPVSMGSLRGSLSPAAGEFLEGIRDDLKARRYAPSRVREKMIPKASGKLRRLGIATAAGQSSRLC